jgi:histidine triad (HIT) family protein
MGNCIFCSIVAGDIPATKVYEDEAVLAFMDIGPIVKGHTLVIPKAHFESIVDVPPALLAKVIQVCQRVAKAQLDGLAADGVNIHQSNGAVAGQAVGHIHFHIIPRFADDGHSWNWNAQEYGDSSEAATLAARISAALERQ